MRDIAIVSFVDLPTCYTSAILIFLDCGNQTTTQMLSDIPFFSEIWAFKRTYSTGLIAVCVYTDEACKRNENVFLYVGDDFIFFFFKSSIICFVSFFLFVQNVHIIAYCSLHFFFEPTRVPRASFPFIFPSKYCSVLSESCHYNSSNRFCSLPFDEIQHSEVIINPKFWLNINMASFLSFLGHPFPFSIPFPSFPSLPSPPPSPCFLTIANSPILSNSAKHV